MRRIMPTSWKTSGRWAARASDRGALVLLAVDDHKYRIEVGYGLEGILPDGKVGDIGREMVPYLRANDYDWRVTLAVDEMAQVIAADAKVTLNDEPAPASQPVHQRATAMLGKLILLLFRADLLWRLSSAAVAAGLWACSPASVGGRRPWGGGGGFGGGGFGGGGFGGGGGGLVVLAALAEAELRRRWSRGKLVGNFKFVMKVVPPAAGRRRIKRYEQGTLDCAGSGGRAGSGRADGVRQLCERQKPDGGQGSEREEPRGPRWTCSCSGAPT